MYFCVCTVYLLPTGMSLVVVHWATATLRLRRWATLTGLCYVVVKVALLLVIEVDFP